MRYILTCNPGVEKIVGQEVAEKIEATVHGRFRNLWGRVLIETDAQPEQLRQLRSIYHIIQLVSDFSIQTDAHGLADIYQQIGDVAISQMEHAEAFRVTSVRTGDHDFTSVDVQRSAGQALDEQYATSVDLERYDVNVRCDVVADRCYVGLQLTDTSLHHRFERPFDHPAAIKAPLAYCLLRLADLQPDERLLDPFCGGGTIAIEAAQAYNGLTIFASDHDSAFVTGTQQNISAAGVSENVTVQRADARELDCVYNTVDAIVCNLPYGVKMGRHFNLHALFYHFLSSAHSILADTGVIVVITLPARTFRDAASRITTLQIKEELGISIGDLTPHIFVIRKYN